MEYRKARRADLDLLAENRMEFVRSIREVDDAEDFRLRIKRYMETHIETDALVILIAVAQGKIIASRTACIMETPPRPSCRSGKSAFVPNVFTHEQYRRQGHAEKLLRMLIAEAESRDVENIALEYTEDGFPLYEKLGVTVAEHQMALKRRAPGRFPS